MRPAPDPLPAPPTGRGALEPSHGRLVGLVLIGAVIVGIQLGALPYRYRKQLWQLQGAAVGVVVGYVIGRFSRPAD